MKNNNNAATSNAIKFLSDSAALVTSMLTSNEARAWDTAFAGATDQKLFSVEMGFSGLPRVGYHAGLGSVSVGAEFTSEGGYGYGAEGGYGHGSEGEYNTDGYWPEGGY